MRPETSERELEQMRQNPRRRDAERAQTRLASLQQARSDCARIVRHVAATYRPRRIWQWGSLVNGEHFTERSDIDLGLEGIDTAVAFFAVLRDAAGMTRFPLDIVQLETIHPEFAESIRSRGRVLYEG
jgi:hypothetical protein